MTMRPHTETGSLLNHLMSRPNLSAATPEIGMGATVLCWSDRNAATVIDYNEKAQVVTVQQDKATRTDANGMSDCQEWSYERDPEGIKTKFRRGPNGSWYEVGFNEDTGRWRKSGNFGLRLGVRDEYYDFSF